MTPEERKELIDQLDRSYERLWGILMNDKELLERAAKAAGIVVIRSRLDDPMHKDLLVEDSHRNPFQQAGPWNPLTDDGDALRLMVKLMLGVGPNLVGDKVVADTGFRPISAAEPYDPDPYAATRRAIVRAAAALVEGE
jgi:hypothetical protein